MPDTLPVAPIDYTAASPQTDATGEPFWTASAEGALAFQRCAEGHAFHYPRPFCPRCWSTDLTWHRSAGEGVVYTCSTVRQNDLPPFRHLVPYDVAVVDLAEGFRVQARLTSDIGTTKPGDRVAVSFERWSDTLAMPVFGPAGP